MHLEKLHEIVVSKLDPKPGETLVVTLKSDDIDEFVIQALKSQLKSAFPGIRVMLMGIGLDESVRFAVMDQTGIGCGVDSYCIDCTCDKKESMEG